MPADSAENAQPIDPRALTWGVLLGRWTDFAQSAIALPATAEGKRLRASVPDLIMLQAVWFALRDLDELDPAERALGLDRAEILIDRHAAALEERWKREAVPEQMRSLIDDARAALTEARQREQAAGSATPPSPSPGPASSDRP